MRYFISFLVAIGLIILLIFLIFHGGGKSTVPNAKTLSSYANTDAEVRLTIDGPVNAPQNHQQVQITVDRNTITFDQLQGYDGSVVNQQTFANSDTGYAAFLLSLEHSGFSVGNTSKSLADERGYCPLGDRYIMELRQDGTELERFWATTCGGTKTYGGNVDLTLNLFQNQVPGYEDLVQNVTF